VTDVTNMAANERLPCKELLQLAWMDIEKVPGAFAARLCAFHVLKSVLEQRK
jgi:hypothetical protein